MRLATDETRITHTTCPYCGVGCGVEVTVTSNTAGDSSIKVRGDKQHPANFGRLCSKGAALAETLDLDNRLLEPRVDGETVSWDTALDKVAGTLQRIIDEHGPDAVAFYVSGQLLTEDYYVANKLMKGFIGSANIDTNSRLCMSSSVAGHKRAFGSDTVPCSYADLETAELVILTGSNTAWCHPVLFQRLRQSKKDNPNKRIVVIDPRRTESCEIADLHLPLRAGTDITLFNGLLTHLVNNGAIDTAFIEQHSNGFDNALELAVKDAPDINSVASACGLEAQDVATFYQWFVETPRTVTVYSQGVNQWSCGTDKVNAIINCHLASGRIGKAGAGPFSFTGQPNAMGGREVGGLANQLAAHMDFDEQSLQTVADFWQAPRLANAPGLKAIDLMQAIEQGKVKALWVMATNPLASLPEADRFRKALKKCDMLVVSDCVSHNDTIELANVLLPATTWGEKDGTVTNSERRISRQRAFLPAPEQAKPDWWIISEVAVRMGYAEAFNYSGPAAIFREHAALSAYANAGQRDFNLQGLTSLSDQAYEKFKPLQWPVKDTDSAALFSDGRFFHADGKARFIPVQNTFDYPLPDKSYPLVLNTGRIRDQWHSMTRTGKVARLSSHFAEPFVEIHPHDAAHYNIDNEQLVSVSSRNGSLLAKALISDKQQRGNLFIPMHWNRSNAAQGPVGRLVNAVVDPYSGQPQFKHTPVTVSAISEDWHGFILCREALPELPFRYWVKTTRPHMLRYQLTGSTAMAEWPELARLLFGDEGDWIEFHDDASGYYRAALIKQGRLHASLFIASDHTLPDDQWLDSLFDTDELDRQSRISLLSGQTPGDVKSGGRTVCACFNVGVNTIIEAIQTEQLTSIEALGQALQAGTNCGSCVPELKEILQQHNAAGKLQEKGNA
jgi:assimilatory nitrate reductase catalytic subunit